MGNWLPKLYIHGFKLLISPAKLFGVRELLRCEEVTIQTSDAISFSMYLTSIAASLKQRFQQLLTHQEKIVLFQH